MGADRIQAVCCATICAYLGWVLPANTLYDPSSQSHVRVSWLMKIECSSTATLVHLRTSAGQLPSGL